MDSGRAPSWQVSESSNGRGGDDGGAGYNTKFSDSSSEGSGPLLVDVVEDGAVAGDHGVYHVRLEFDPLSHEAITLRCQQLRVAWQAAMDDTGGKGSLTRQVHCEFMVGSETIRPHFTQWVHAGFFLKVPTNLPPKNPPGKG